MTETIPSDPIPYHKPRVCLLHVRPVSDPDLLARWTLATADCYARKWGADLRIIDMDPSPMPDEQVLRAMYVACKEEGYDVVGGSPPGWLWVYPDHGPTSSEPITRQFSDIEEARKAAQEAWPELCDPERWNEIFATPEVVPVSPTRVPSGLRQPVESITGGVSGAVPIRESGTGIASCLITP